MYCDTGNVSDIGKCCYLVQINVSLLQTLRGKGFCPFFCTRSSIIFVRSLKNPLNPVSEYSVPRPDFKIVKRYK